MFQNARGRVLQALGATGRDWVARSLAAGRKVLISSLRSPKGPPKTYRSLKLAGFTCETLRDMLRATFWVARGVRCRFAQAQVATSRLDGPHGLHAS